MIDGITILSQQKVSIETVPLIVCIIVTGIFIIGMVLALIVDKKDLEDLSSVGCVLSVVFGILSVLFWVVYMRDHNKSKTRIEYKVLISDDVKLNEFEERYKIIDKEGLIYTITEKI